MRTLTIAATTLVALAACRPELGPPQYPSFDPFEDEDALLGPFPDVEGTERLSIGEFYESGYSEIIEIDGAQANYFIYSDTYTQAPSEDRIEGLVSSAITVSGAQPWWGGGIIWDPTIDLSGWTTLHVSLLAEDGLFDGTNVAIGSSTLEARVAAADYGFEADGQWHNLVIPVSDFTGVDMSDIRVAFSLIADLGTPDATILVDDVYYTKE